MTAASRERLLSLLEQRAPELIDFTCDLIATPSPNPPGDERAVVNFISQALERFGYLRPADPVSGTRPPQLDRPHRCTGCPFARLPGSHRHQANGRPRGVENTAVRTEHH